MMTALARSRPGILQLGAEQPAPWIGLQNARKAVSQPEGHDRIPLTMVKPGDNFTMTCLIDRTDAGLLYWYRMSSEPMIETIAEGSYDKITLDKKFNPRFSVTKVQENVYSLNIFNVTKEDEASYFCQAGTSYRMTFYNTTFLLVAPGNNPFYVDQIPSVSAPLGGSVQLNCSLLSKRDSSVQCPSKRTVHWFRSGPEKTSTIYTYEQRADDQDQRKCVYSLTTTLQDFNDTGTYYCAVATCGEILFGNGTRVDINSGHEMNPVVIVLAVLLVLFLFVIAVLVWSRKETL